MVQSQFSLSWESYKNNICNGFSSLQQNGEFVDMTIAADGHFVKVHQVLMALASPYLKELITSAPCQHPVIFLNNVSHKTLSSLLEYVYTGEVLVPSENLMPFVETAKALHISGLEDLNSNQSTYKLGDTLENVDDNLTTHVTGVRSLELPAAGSKRQIKLPAAARKVFIKSDSSIRITSDVSQNVSLESSDNMNEITYTDVMDTGNDHDDNDSGDDLKSSNVSVEKNVPDPNTPASNLQFSVSIRGSLQIILNRYIYNLHSTQHQTGIRRWRCVDYRNHQCKAFVVTKGNVVLNRANLHNHAFHDKKILQKIEKNAVFSALDDIHNYNKKQENLDKEDSGTEQEDNSIQTLQFVDPMVIKKEWSKQSS